MPNICLTIAYDGTKYAGWQIQKNAKTIQGEIEKALRKILKEKIKLIGSGRTDSGVHAKAQVANFTTKRNIKNHKLIQALNSNLPRNISIIKVKKISRFFHSQFSAKSKIYRYAIHNSQTRDPFREAYSHRVPYRLNISVMRKEAKALRGKHDFKAFQAKSSLSGLKTTKRTIESLCIKKDKNAIYIDIEADGFLHNMVRNIVGTLIEIGRGYLPRGSIKRILASKNRRLAGPTAPAKGLALFCVKYN